MDVEKSSLCNCVVNFLLEENYLLSAFELLHELLEDGRDDQAIRLKEYFSSTTHFPPDQISRFCSLRVAEPQHLLEEKGSLEEKLAVSEYELRLAQEDILNLKDELLKKGHSKADESKAPNVDVSAKKEPINQSIERTVSYPDLGILKDNERVDINCAVKEYLLLAGYRLTAVTFYEEVTDQNLDVWHNSSACVPDALRQYYYKYLSSSAEGAEVLLKENSKLKNERQSLVKSKQTSDAQLITLTKSFEVLKKDVKDKENQVQSLKKALERQRKDLNECRAEITSLKMHIEGTRTGKVLLSTDSVLSQSLSSESHHEEKERSQNEVVIPKEENYVNAEPIVSMKTEGGNEQETHEVEEPKVNDAASPTVGSLTDLNGSDTLLMEKEGSGDTTSPSEKLELLSSSSENGFTGKSENFLKNNKTPFSETDSVITRSDNFDTESNAEKGVETIQILSSALPKIVPYVLINHREELLPLIMCAIERHPDSGTRDSLTHTLFNLIKRPDEQQRRIIMNACVTLAKNVGELRTETELLPQCWEQVNHMYEERRILVAQSCGELAEFVQPEIRDSLILSIVQQLIEDSASVVREAAVHNLALLLPLFPNTDKYFKVEEMMFKLICDPSSKVVEATIKELVPAILNWGNELDHILQVLLSYIMAAALHCPPHSGLEGSIESHLRVLGERERQNLEVLLRLLDELLSHVHQHAVETCPFPEVSDTGISCTPTLLGHFAGGHEKWPAFEWLHRECFPSLIRLSSLLPPKEDKLRICITRFLLAVTGKFGESYLTHIMLPVFLVAVGNNADLKFFSSEAQSNIKDLMPLTATAKTLATMGVLPLLLAGVLGHPSKHDHLTEYLRELLIQSPGQDHNQPARNHIMNSVRFICNFEEHHDMIFNILWEMVASSDVNLKIDAANLTRVIIPYIEAKVVSIHILPALVTLGSDQYLSVKYASIDAFGAVAKHFKEDVIVDKIRIQMDAFLEEGSHEATIAVIRALLVSVSHTTDQLWNYLMSKIFQLTALPPPANDVIRRRERANAFCESIRALDATDLAASTVKDLLLPAIQNLLKDSDALDPAHKEALEIILKERSGGALDTISKVMGGQMGFASSVSSLFGEGGLLGKKESGEAAISAAAPPHEMVEPPHPPPEDTAFRRIMRGGFTDMLRAKPKGSEESQSGQ